MTSSETQYFALLRSASPQVIDKLQDWLLKIAGQNLKMDNVLSQSLRALKDNGIEPVLLKGQGAASYYREPMLRESGDIDLYVGLDHFHEACQLLRTMPGGYNWGEEVDVGHHYNIEFGQYPMEIHRVSADVNDANFAETYSSIEQDGLHKNLQHVDFEGLNLTLPSKEFVVFFTFFHAWHHFLTSGVGWRQISDVALALHAYHGQLDLEKMRRWLSDMHLVKPWQTFGYLMVEQLGLPETEMPFYDARCRRTAQRLYSNVMEVGNFSRNSRFKQRHPKSKLMRKLHSFIGIFVDFFYRVRIFPMAAFSEMRTSLKLAMGKARKVVIN